MHPVQGCGMSLPPPTTSTGPTSTAKSGELRMTHITRARTSFTLSSSFDAIISLGLFAAHHGSHIPPQLSLRK